MSAIALTRIHSRTRELAPGFIVSLIVAAAASFLSEHYGAPVMLFALLLGMARARPVSNSPPVRCCALAWRCWACASPWSKWRRWAGSR
jgi:hypothetical protein